MPKLIKKIILENLAIMLMTMLFSLGLGVVIALASRPASAPPVGMVNAPGIINAGTMGQAKQGNLLITGLNTSGTPYSNGLIVLNGNVGVGSLDPAAKVDVSGGVKIANDTGACNSSKAGTIRFNGSIFEGCDGSIWKSIAPISAPIVVCTPDSPLTQTLQCAAPQTGLYTQTKYSTCAAGAAAPTYGDWVTNTPNTCVTPKAVEYTSVKYTFVGATADFTCTPYNGTAINYFGTYTSKDTAIRATKRSLESCLTNSGTYSKGIYDAGTNIGYEVPGYAVRGSCIRTTRYGCTSYMIHPLTSATSILGNSGTINNFWHQDFGSIVRSTTYYNYILNGTARFVDYNDVLINPAGSAVGRINDYPTESVHLRTTKCPNVITDANSSLSRCSVSDIVIPTYGIK